MWTKKKEAVKLARGGTLGTSIAELRLDHPDVYFALTNERTGHVIVWAFPRLLLDCVISCTDTGE
jgi:hypothetical protein